MDTELYTVLAALSTIRAPRTASEYSLHGLVRDALLAHGLPFRHEVSIAPRRRIDILCGTVGIEIKRGKPQATPLMRQLAAYAESGTISALILVADHPPKVPQAVCGKPLACLSLQRLWGIAL